MMSPAAGQTFEARVRRSLDGLLSDVGAKIVIDEIDIITEDAVLLVDFHLEGAWSSPAGFSFTFHEAAPLDLSVRAMKDMIEKNWNRAHLAPPVVARHRHTSASSAGAD